MNKRIAISAFSMAIAVGLGAMAAHFLKTKLDPEALNSFQTGVRYQIYHSLALLVLAATPFTKGYTKPWTLMLVGMCFFSFSIYGLTLRPLMGQEGGLLFLGPITPLGGMLLIIAWLWIAIAALRSN